MKNPISIIIPSFNGLDLLKKNLTSVTTALKTYAGGGEIIVVDDGSTDETRLFLQANFPLIQIIFPGPNRGFIQAANTGVQNSKNGIVIILNNDIQVEPDFIDPLVENFTPGVFAVTTQSWTKRGEETVNESISRADIQSGQFILTQPAIENPSLKYDYRCTIFWAPGGFSAFDRAKFNELKGFDRLYFPCFWEDVDLSFRAWKRGWKIIYEPRSVVHHQSHATLQKIYSPESLEKIHTLNKYRFILKNISEPECLGRLIEEIGSYFLLPLEQRMHLKSQARLEFLHEFRKITRLRSGSAASPVLSDREIMAASVQVRI